MKSIMQHSFSNVPRANISRSTFDRTHGHKTTFDPDYLIPIFIDEALPGDTHMLNMTALARLLSPLKVPLMDNIKIDFHFFKVPLRLLWTNFPKFMGEQTDPGDSTAYTTPQMPLNYRTVMSLADYFGLPVGTTQQYEVNTLPFRAYNLIYNEWYRDQNLIDSVVVDLDDGPDSAADYELLKRGKRHDYFTSCLPWPQKGTAIDLPLGSTAPVILNTSSTDAVHFVTASTQVDLDGSTLGVSSGHLAVSGGSQSGNAQIDPDGSLLADLSSATSATVNELREAFALQRMLEKDARGGTRYIELIQMHFGVTNPDFRLQRPEFIGGGSININATLVANTSATATEDQGSLAAFASGSDGNIGFTTSCTEHSLIIGLASARADLTYQQGTDKLWLRETKVEHFWPDLAKLGEQVVENREIWHTNEATPWTINKGTFGYQERYGEYRYKKSLITGKFRSDVAGTLDMWHLSQDFATLPVLGETFINETMPIDRVIAVEDEPAFIMDMYFKLKSVRPMPVHGIPGMTGHL